MTPVALGYSRVSSDEQGREGLSLPAQVAACRDYARRQGWSIGAEFQDVMTGKRDDRPGYQALLDEVRSLRAQGRPVVVVVAWLHRLGRRVVERVRAWEELEALGVAIHSVSEGGQQSRLVYNILASVAEEESRQIGDRVSATWAYTTGLGWFKGGQPPFGYRWRPATAGERAEGAPRSVLEPSGAAEYVTEAFQRLADGESTRAVGRWLASLPLDVRSLPRSEVFAARRAANGHEAPAEDHTYDVTWRTIQKMLRNPVYVGRPVHSDQPVLERPRARWAPLISDELWTRVQARLNGNGPTSTRASQRYLLTGLLRCPACGHKMRGGSTTVKDPKRPYGPYAAFRYRCSGDGRGLLCPQTAQRDIVDRAVLGQVGGVIEAAMADPSGVERAWSALTAPDDRDAARRKQLESDITKAKARRARATDLLLDGTLAKADYDSAVSRADEMERVAVEELAKLNASVRVVDLPPLAEVLRKLGGWRPILEGSDVATQRQVVGALVESIVPVRVKRGEYRLSITWTPLGRALSGAQPEQTA